MTVCRQARSCCSFAIRNIEADEIIRQVLTEVRQTFLTPFDRSAITALIVAMDDTIDEMLAAARAIDLYGLQELRPEMELMVDLIKQSADLTAACVPAASQGHGQRGQAARADRRDRLALKARPMNSTPRSQAGLRERTAKIRFNSPSRARCSRISSG